jgi:hypothetical protein
MEEWTSKEEGLGIMRRRRPVPPTHHLKTAIRQIDQIVWKLHDEQLAAYIAYVLTVSKGEKREIRKLWLANCYLAHDSSGFPVLLPFSRLPHACHQSRHHVAARGRKQHCWKPRTQSE